MAGHGNEDEAVGIHHLDRVSLTFGPSRAGLRSRSSWCRLLWDRQSVHFGTNLRRQGKERLATWATTAGQEHAVEGAGGIYPPTKASRRVDGQPLCSTSPGFEPEATGWENIVTAATCKAKPNSIHAKSLIAAFSELGEFSTCRCATIRRNDGPPGLPLPRPLS